MEIILREAIEKLGHAGDVVKVKNGYARNYLLPRKKAYLATQGNLKIMEQEKTKLLRHEAEQRAEAEKLAEALSSVEISVERRVGPQDTLYGSVTNADVAEQLEAKGFSIDKRKILLEDHIKSIGEFQVPIRLFTEVIAEVKLTVVPQGGVSPEEEVAAAPAEAPLPPVVDEEAAAAAAPEGDEEKAE